MDDVLADLDALKEEAAALSVMLAVATSLEEALRSPSDEDAPDATNALLRWTEEDVAGTVASTQPGKLPFNDSD